MAEHDEALVAKAAEALVPWTPQPTDLANQEYRALCDAYREKAARAVLDAVAPAIEARAKAAAWDEGHAAGREYQGDGWNCDVHDPRDDNPYRIEGA